MPHYILIATGVSRGTQGDAALAAEMAEYIRNEIAPDCELEIMLLFEDYDFDVNMHKYLHWQQTLAKKNIKLILKKASECEPQSFVAYDHVIGYPFGDQYARLFINCKNCLFLNPYNYPHHNPFYESRFSTGIGDSTLGIWLKTPVESFPLETIESIVDARMAMNKPKEYVAYLNSSMANLVTNTNIANYATFIGMVNELESGQNNDVIIYCNIQPDDINQIERILPSLKFKTIFYGLSGEEKVHVNKANPNNRTLKVINVFPLPQAAFQTLLKHAEPICAVTGNTSIIEAIQLGKVPIYQTMYFNEPFFYALTILAGRELEYFLKLSQMDNPEKLLEYYKENSAKLQIQVKNLATVLEHFDIKMELLPLLMDYLNDMEANMNARYKEHYLRVLHIFKDNNPEEYENSNNLQFRILCRKFKNSDLPSKLLPNLYLGLNKLTEQDLEYIATELATRHRYVKFNEIIEIADFVNQLRAQALIFSLPNDKTQIMAETARLRTNTATEVLVPLRPRNNTI